MAKKRKAPGASKGKAVPGEDFNKRVRLNVDTYEDVAGSDDEFYIGRDKVLLDETAAEKRSRGIKEREEFLEPSDEEVLGYSDEDDEAEVDSEDEDIDDGGKNTADPGSDGESHEEEEEDDEMNEWGASKQDFYGADQMETEQDALDEEAEAKRLQQKQLASMKAADYGFDEDEWAGKEKSAKEKPKSKTVTEALPRLAITADMSSAERLKILKSRFPEFEPLSKEFLDLQTVVATIRQTKKDNGQEIASGGDSKYTDRPASGLEIKERAASAYLAVLAMYFALLTSSATEAAAEGTATILTNVKDHPIMDTLLSSRDLWLQVKDLPEVDEEDELVDDKENMSEDAEDGAMELEKPKRKRVRKTKAQKAASAAARDADARRTLRMEQAEADLADLDNLLARQPKKTVRSKSKPSNDNELEDDSDFGETELSEKALAEKAAKRKSLRFYTSQIAQKSNKRGAAGRSAGGDDDIPYRERLKDRQARLNAEATKRGQRGTAGDDLGGDSDEDDRAQARAIRAAVDQDLDNGDDYYQHIASKSANKKADKEALAAARKDALLNGGRVVESEVVGEDGKRKISYAIEKNKGLTPHRKKDVRNPRVKKRKKYDERKKKLGSMRAVYKGGEGRGGYGGELTGIKSNLVKSRKL